MTQLDPLTHKPDGAPRPVACVIPGVTDYELDPGVVYVGAPGELVTMPVDVPHVTYSGFCDLLSAKDTFVRARIP